MRIIRNGVRVSMGMEELIELLESDLIDSVIDTLINLDDSDIEADFVIAMDMIDIDSDEIEDTNGVFFLDPDGNELDFDGIKEEIKNRTFSHYLTDDLYLLDHAVGSYLTDEDRRVKNMLKLFSLDEDLDYA